MSSAEVTAYLLGSTTAVDVQAWLAAGDPGSVVPDVPLSPGQQRAMEQLGEERFAYWALRGALEAKP